MVVDPPIRLQHAFRTRRLKHLNQIVKGEATDHTITITDEILYFTNITIRHFEFLRNRQIKDVKDGGAGSDFYISPRTQAKSLDLLRALAMLKGRTDVKHEDVSRLYFIFATVGLPEEVALFKKAYRTTLNSLTASDGFEQITVLLDFATILDQIRADPSLMSKPLSQFAGDNVRRSFFEWVREKFGAESPEEHNKMVLEQFLKDYVPSSDEVRELKHSIEQVMAETMTKVERELNKAK